MEITTKMDTSDTLGKKLNKSQPHTDFYCDG